MGCAGSKKNEHAVPALRRRLSLGEIGPADSTQPEGEVSEKDRSLLMQLTEQQVLEFVKAAETNRDSRRYSVSSNTDKKGHLVRSFSSKTLKLEGDEFDGSQENIGYACKKGLKPEAPNQDSFLIMRIEEQYAIYGVFDGHGRKGHDVSNFVKDNMPKILFQQSTFPEDPVTALLKTFEKTQELIEKATRVGQIDATRSGTTCSLVLHLLPQKMLYFAHVGDSRIVLGKQSSVNGKQQWQAMDLTIDHKPDLPEEKARIEKAGGVVLFDGGWNYRVFAKGKTDSRGKRYPGLNMSRAMGDLNGFNDAGISAIPDVKSKRVNGETEKINNGMKSVVNVGDGANGASSDNQLNAETAMESGGASGEISKRPSLHSSTPSVSQHSVDPDTDKFLLICSDGVWEFVSSEQAVEEVGAYPKEAAGTAAERLACVSWDCWMSQMDGQVVDDITAVVVHFEH